jgi:hypothetical protein
MHIVTLAWDKQQNVVGYRLLKNGDPISFSWDPNKTSWRVTYADGDVFDVKPIYYAPGARVGV